MSYSVVSSKGQITLPAKIRKRFGIHPNSKIQFLIRESDLVIKPVKSFRDLRGTITPKKGDPRKAAQAAVSKHVTDMDD
jgi:AbrB family looped-hinge helix DNA binding protein